MSTERLDDETERLINAIQVAAVTDFTEELPRPAISRIYSSPEKVNALRTRIRELIEETREQTIRTIESAWRP